MCFFYFRSLNALLFFLFFSSYSLAKTSEEDIFFSQDLEIKRQLVIDQLKDFQSSSQDIDLAPLHPSPAAISINEVTFYGLEDVGLTVEDVLKLIRCPCPVANLRLSHARSIPVPSLNKPFLHDIPAPKPKKKRRRWFFFGPRG